MADPFDWLRGLLGGGDPEAAGAAAASQAMEPNVLQYAQDVLSGRMAAGGPAGQNAAYDPTKSFRENALRPDGLEAAMSMVGPAAIRAYHGSPFNFSRFDASKIGTGEGTQIFGRGLYFAESEDVARRYKNKLSDPNRYTVPMTLDGAPVSSHNWVDVQNQMWARGDKEGAYLAQMLGDANRYNVRTMGALKKLYNADYGPTLPWGSPFGDIDAAFRALRGRAQFAPPRGRMYEVDIHADPEAFLNLDAPWAAQSASVQRGINDVHGSFGQSYVGTNYAPMLAGTPEFAAQLNAAGVPGTRYLDQYSRSTTPNPTRNYVVFDDKTTPIEILRKYGLLPPLAVGAGGLGGLGGTE